MGSIEASTMTFELTVQICVLQEEYTLVAKSLKSESLRLLKFSSKTFAEFIASWFSVTKREFLILKFEIQIVIDKQFAN